MATCTRTKIVIMHSSNCSNGHACNQANKCAFLAVLSPDAYRFFSDKVDSVGDFDIRDGVPGLDLDIYGVWGFCVHGLL